MTNVHVAIGHKPLATPALPFLFGLVLLLAACTQQQPTPVSTPAPTPLPAIGSASTGGSATASGEIVPARRAQLGFPTAGRVQEVGVEVGDAVAAGDVLVALDNAAATANVKQAEAALLRAEARLAELKAGPRPQEIAATQAQLEAIQAHLIQLSETDPEQIAAARARLAAAEARHDTLYSEPNPAIVADAWAQVQDARAALDRLINPATQSQIAEAEAQVRTAEAELDLLTAGVREETLAVAAIDVADAEATLRHAEAELANATLRAPFTGTVTALDVNPGEMVLPGQRALTLADLNHLQAETIDLSERDVAAVEAGQSAVVFVESLGVEVPGRVARIAPQATIIGGDVVYAVLIDLDEQPDGLRWGMSVEVDIAGK